MADMDRLRQMPAEVSMIKGKRIPDGRVLVQLARSRPG